LKYDSLSKEFADYKAKSDYLFSEIFRYLANKDIMRLVHGSGSEKSAKEKRNEWDISYR